MKKTVTIWPIDSHSTFAALSRQKGLREPWACLQRVLRYKMADRTVFHRELSGCVCTSIHALYSSLSFWPNFRTSWNRFCRRFSYFSGREYGVSIVNFQSGYLKMLPMDFICCRNSSVLYGKIHEISAKTLNKNENRLDFVPSLEKPLQSKDRVDENKIWISGRTAATSTCSPVQGKTCQLQVILNC